MLSSKKTFDLSSSSLKQSVSTTSPEKLIKFSSKSINNYQAKTNPFIGRSNRQHFPDFDHSLSVSNPSEHLDDNTSFINLNLSIDTLAHLNPVNFSYDAETVADHSINNKISDSWIQEDEKACDDFFLDSQNTDKLKTPFRLEKEEEMENNVLNSSYLHKQCSDAITKGYSSLEKVRTMKFAVSSKLDLSSVLLSPTNNSPMIPLFQSLDVNSSSYISEHEEEKNWQECDVESPCLSPICSPDVTRELFSELTCRNDLSSLCTISFLDNPSMLVKQNSSTKDIKKDEKEVVCENKEIQKENDNEIIGKNVNEQKKEIFTENKKSFRRKYRRKGVKIADRNNISSMLKEAESNGITHLDEKWDYINILRKSTPISFQESSTWNSSSSFINTPSTTTSFDRFNYSFSNEPKSSIYWSKKLLSHRKSTH